jgi:hypothetical protein
MRQGSSRVTQNPLTQTLVPTPTNGSAHYKFLGRQLGELETILSRVPPTPSTSAPTTGPVPVIYIDDDDEELSQNFMAAIERTAHIAAADSLSTDL